MKTKATLLMTTWNALSFIKLTLASLYETTENFDLIIFDNGSRKEVVDYLTEFVKDYKNARLIIGQTNLGVWKSRHLASKFVNTELVGTIDTDLMFPKGWLDKFVNKLNDYDVGQVGPIKLTSRFVYPYEKNTPLNEAWRKCESVSSDPLEQLKLFTNGKKFEEFTKDLVANNEIKSKLEVPPRFTSGCCMLTRTELFIDPSINDTNYGQEKYGFEDLDYSWSIASRGLKVCIAEDVYVHHFEHSSVDENKLDINNNRSLNAQYFYNKWEDSIVKWLETLPAEKALNEFLVKLMYQKIPDNIPTRISSCLDKLRSTL